MFSRRRATGTAAALLAGISSLTACGASADANAKEVTVYSADGLKSAIEGSGRPSWLDQAFGDFTKQTGIKVNYIEGGSGEVVTRAQREKNNTKADVLITLPPFIQQAAAKGLLAKAHLANAGAVRDKDPNGMWTAAVENYVAFVNNTKVNPATPKSFDDLLNPSLKGKVQYSTPGQAGDGTAFLIAAIHANGDNEEAGLAYLKRLQANNVGPSSSTGALTTKVNKGELAVSNGDLQMNGLIALANKNVKIWMPADPGGKPFTLALPYAMGQVKKAPHPANAAKLMDFLLAPEQQKTISELAAGIPARDDIKPSDATYRTMQKSLDGVQVWRPDWATIQRTLPQLALRWHSATGS